MKQGFKVSEFQSLEVSVFQGRAGAIIETLKL